MGIGEVEDLMERAERKKRKAARRAAKQRQLERQNTNRGGSNRGSSLADVRQASANAMAGFTTSVAGILRQRSTTTVRRVGRGGDEEDAVVESNGSAIEMTRIRSGTPSPDSVSGAGSGSAPGSGARVGFNTPSDTRTEPTTNQQSTNSETSSTSQTPSLHPPQTFGQLVAYPATAIQLYLRRLRRAHEDAAKKKALQQVELRQQVFERRERTRREEEGLTSDDEAHRPAKRTSKRQRASRSGALAGDDGVGWGLGSFGIKEHRESARRLAVARERLQEDRLLSDSQGDDQVDQAGRIEASGSRNRSGSRRRGEPPRLGAPLPSTDPGGAAISRSGDDDDSVHGCDNEGGGDGGGGGVGARAGDTVLSEEEWEDIEEERAARERARPFMARTSSESVRPENPMEPRVSRDRQRDGDAELTESDSGETTERGNRRDGDRAAGWSWWGPLRDWRLSDRSVF